MTFKVAAASQMPFSCHKARQKTTLTRHSHKSNTPQRMFLFLFMKLVTLGARPVVGADAACVEECAADPTQHPEHPKHEVRMSF